jgi:hypothetical protein
VLAALVLRAVGAANSGYTFTYLSIGASGLAALCFLIAVLRHPR